MKSQVLVGEYIKSLREENEITQTQFAKELQVEPQTISKWETGNGYPDITMFEKIASYFRIKIDDIFECTDNANRNTLFKRKETFNNNCKKMYSLLLNFEESSNSKNMFISLINVLWIYNEEEMEFFDPKSGFKYDKSFFKDFIIAHFLWVTYTYFIEFLIANFNMTHSNKLIDYMKAKGHLHKYLFSFIGPLKEFYPHDSAKYPLLNEVEYKLHPQIDEIRTAYIKSTGQEFLRETNIKKVIEKIDFKYYYNYEQIILLFPSISGGYGKNGIYENPHDNKKKNLSSVFNDAFDNLYINDAWKSIDYIMSKANIDILKEKLLNYIERILTTANVDDLINSIDTYIKHWPLNQKELLNILFKTQNIEYITVFIDKYGFVPNDKDLFSKYAEHKNLADSETIKKLMKRIQKLEFLVISLEKKLEAAINNKVFIPVDYDD